MPQMHPLYWEYIMPFSMVTLSLACLKTYYIYPMPGSVSLGTQENMSLMLKW